MNSRLVAEYEFVSAALFSISMQAGSIARGLEKVAPSASSAGTGSIHYLLAVAAELKMESASLLPERAGSEPTYDALIRIVQQIVQQDVALREKYQVEDRFRFVKDRLHDLLQGLKDHASQQSHQLMSETIVTVDEHASITMGEAVYIYLYNAQGAILRTWAAMLTPRAFYEYSVNRPVYQEKKSIEEVIAQKSNPLQHAYMTVMVGPDDVLSYQTPVRVKEGALKLDRLVLFTHNGQDFIFSGGELVKKR